MSSTPPGQSVAYRIRFDECGPDGRLRPSGHLRLAQDVAWIHSENLGFGRDWYRERGLTWLVRAIALDIAAGSEFGETLGLTTRVVGWRRVWARRRTTFEVDGRVRAVALTDWVLLGPTGAPVRVPAEIAAAFTVEPPSFAPLRVELPDPPDHVARVAVAVRQGDLDPMGHVNHAVYLDYADAALAQGHGAQRLHRAELEYLLPADAATAPAGRLWRLGHAWAYLLEDDAGRPLFRARLRTSATG
ncbi:MAG TPA: acyl-ACP thioesterase domain-containing protein [Candidatus Limnocylindrales bacterium]|nr:acyl-ACP thioesterase domain-containing protein [Candidatus Limnocylindrales bacterium]